MSGTITAATGAGFDAHFLALSPDGSHLAAASITTRNVAIIATANHQGMTSISNARMSGPVAYLPDGKTLLMTDQLGDLVTVNPATGKVLDTVLRGVRPAAMVVNASGTMAYATEEIGTRVLWIDIARGKIVKSIAMPGATGGIALSSDGATLYAVMRGQFDPTADTTLPGTARLLVLDSATGKKERTIKVAGAPFMIDVNPDETIAYLTDLNDPMLGVLDLTTGDLREPIPVPEQEWDIALSPDGATAYLASDDIITTLALSRGTGSSADTSQLSTPHGVARYWKSGDKILKIRKPTEGPAMIFINNYGPSNFAVWTLDDDLQEKDLLVNTIGAYTGTVPLDFDGEETRRLKVSADGPWNMTITSLTSAPRFSTAAAGMGDSILVFQGSTAVATIKNTGSGNIAVWAENADGSDLLVNEIGRYDGDVILPEGPTAITITSDGKWSVRVQPD